MPETRQRPNPRCCGTTNMNNNTNQASEPDYEKMAINAQKKINEEIADGFASIFKSIKRLENVGGTMDYKVYILKILESAEGNVAMAMLSQVLPDNTALVKARDDLEAKNEIVVTSVKNRKTLALVKPD